MSVETEPTAGESIASEASASAKKKTTAAKPKAHLTRRPGRPQVGHRGQRERSRMTRR